MEKYFFKFKPREVELIHFVGSSALVFHSDIREKDKGFEAYEFCINFHKPSDVVYDNTVSNIIRQRYSADAVEAILNNYLNDPESGRKEFEELQSWRAQAKALAKIGLNLIGGDLE